MESTVTKVQEKTYLELIKMAKRKLTVPKPNWISVFHQALFWIKLKLLALSQSTKNKMRMIKLTIDQLVYYQLLQK